MMEQSGYVSGFDGSKPRRVLIKEAEYQRVFCGGGEEFEEDEGTFDEAYDEAIDEVYESDADEPSFDAYSAYTNYNDAPPFDTEDYQQ